MRVSVRLMVVIAAFFYIVLGPVAPRVKGEGTVDISLLGTSPAEIAKGCSERLETGYFASVGSFVSSFLGSKPAKPEPVVVKRPNTNVSCNPFDFTGYAWEAIPGGRSDTTWEAKHFDVAADVAQWSDMAKVTKSVVRDSWGTSGFTMKNDEFAYLTKIYFEKVTYKHRETLTPEFGKKLIFITPSSDQATSDKAVWDRSHEPATFAEHFSRGDGMEWLKKLKAAADRKYSHTELPVPGGKAVVDPMRGTRGSDVSSDDGQLAVLSFGTGRECEALIAYKEVTGNYRLVNRAEEAFDPSQLTEKQKEIDGNIDYLARPGTTVSFVNVDPNFGRTFFGSNGHKRIEESNYQLFRFGSGLHCSFNNEFYRDFNGYNKKELHKKKVHQHEMNLGVTVATKR